MSCYHPLTAQKTFDLDGKCHLKFFGKKALPPSDYSFRGNDDIISIPCGKCIGCRLDYCRSWADRLSIEFLENSGVALFITLTYNNEHIPLCYDSDEQLVSFTLCKRDFQLFMKRLRKYFPDKKIRFFACGEYGSHTLRPHYHAILFGLSFSDFPDLRQVGQNELGQPYFSSAIFESIWQNNGFVALASCSYETFSYVCRYNLKKAYGDNIKPHELAEDSFLLMSRRPGIAGSYYDEHPECISLSHLSLCINRESKKISLPKYFKKRFAIDFPDEYATIALERSRQAKDSILLKFLKSDLPFVEQLEIAENEKLKQVPSILKSREEVSF